MHEGCMLAKQSALCKCMHAHTFVFLASLHVQLCQRCNQLTGAGLECVVQVPALSHNGLKLIHVLELHKGEVQAGGAGAPKAATVVTVSSGLGGSREAGACH